MIQIKGGQYAIGTGDASKGFYSDNETPKTMVQVADFAIDATTVTNADFAAFVQATHYQTEAEQFGNSFVFHLLLDEATKAANPTVAGLPWWYAVDGADWAHPFGPDTNLDGLADHPVVHVSRNDALAYCAWAGKSLPTEAEWEVAARGGSARDHWYWGDSLTAGDTYHCNTFQGDFPRANNAADGFVGTAPVRSFDPNGYGLYQVIGNVWEWCLNPARIPLAHFNALTPADLATMAKLAPDQVFATRGGSFLCHESYCKRYRVSARNGESGQSSASNLGFRCVRRASTPAPQAPVKRATRPAPMLDCCRKD
ncbi:formylglycine-generating enzyme family protein [Lacticaseibacillus daqingensis]|uniref:formylglycine-generating enzyme family protein n=1 Tax=Lacticaseibacillus daqingensis TaxID=2486014 RepID=UPI000F79179C|nr:formylglycine-generating enzyme family protein [Lacticaseibacillus daqingensis]